MGGAVTAISAGLSVALSMALIPAAKAGNINPSPWTKANSVNWLTGWMTPTDGMYTGDFARAQALMYDLSVDAYDSDAGDKFTSALKNDGFDVLGTQNGPGGDNSFAAQAKKGQTPVVNVIGFRGVDDVMSVLGSFLSQPNIRESADGHQYTVHEAYFNAADNAVRKFRPAVASSCEGDPGNKVPLYLTGHNLGGAAAEVAALLLAEQGCRVLGVTALGAPKPGLTNFSEELDRFRVDGVALSARVNRFYRYDDPVPCLMPANGWSQVGHSNYVDKNGALVFNKEANPCDSTDKVVSSIKAILGKVVDIGALSGFFTIANAISALLAWLADKLNLAADCSHPNDSVGSWLGCRVSDLNQVAEFHTMDFDKLFSQLISALSAASNKLDKLQALNNAPWEPPVIAPVHIVVPKFEGEFLPTYVTNTATGETCWTEDVPGTNEQACDMQGPVGYTMTLNFEGAIGNYVSSHGGGMLFDETTPGPGCQWVDRPDFILDQCQLQIPEKTPYTMQIKVMPFPS